VLSSAWSTQAITNPTDDFRTALGDASGTQAEEEPMEAAPILICYDGSDEAKRAIAAAAALLKNRRAIVLNVVPLVTVAESFALAGPGPAVYEDLNRESALEQARAGTKLALEAGLSAEPRGDMGEPTWDGIVAVADEIGAAAIVIGSRGFSAARQLLHGSVSHEVAEHAGRPVMVVPPPHPGPKR
jgi:nucleotide-binding universal stress UspA family protein